MRISFLTGIILLLSVVTAHLLHGQKINEQPKKYKATKDALVVYNMANTMAEAIQFIDTIHNSVKAEFNLKQHNPYRNLVISKNQKDSRKLNSLKSLQGLAKEEIGSTESFHSFYIGENYSVICYELHIYSPEGGEAIHVKGTCFVVNKNGEVVRQLPENDLGYSNPVITENGKYIGSLCGDMASSTNSAQLPGFRIFDVASGTTLVEVTSKELKRSGSVNPPGVIGNLIYERINLTNRNYLYKIYDPEKHVLFQKEYSRDQGIKKNKNGFIIVSHQGENKIDLFEKDFMKSSF